MRKFWGNVGYLVENRVKFEQADSMSRKEVEENFKLLSKKIHDEEKITSKQTKERERRRGNKGRRKITTKNIG